MSQIPTTTPGSTGLQPHRAGLVLTFGIVSLSINVLALLGGLAFAPCCFTSVLPIGLAIPAWIMANTDLRRMNAGEMDPSGRSNTQAGKTCSIISLIVSGVEILLGVLLVVLGIALFAGAAAGGSHP